jgi:predicted TIM-barrel fold metal-dependent hydrolase
MQALQEQLLHFAPQDVQGAVREIERGMSKLKLSGAVVNSNTQGHYLDEPQFLPLLEALEAHDAALYIHPVVPARSLASRMRSGSTSFDRLPRLRVVIGHAGEGMPLLLYRFDWMQTNAERLSRFA